VEAGHFALGGGGRALSWVVKGEGGLQEQVDREREWRDLLKVHPAAPRGVHLVHKSRASRGSAVWRPFGQSSVGRGTARSTSRGTPSGAVGACGRDSRHCDRGTLGAGSGRAQSVCYWGAPCGSLREVSRGRALVVDGEGGLLV